MHLVYKKAYFLCEGLLRATESNCEFRKTELSAESDLRSESLDPSFELIPEDELPIPTESEVKRRASPG